jgi:hypothetical protein
MGHASLGERPLSLVGEGSFESEAIWKMILLCMMWCIWKKRND